VTQRDRFLARQLERYHVRFNDAFWAFFASDVETQLPSAPVLADLGSGPGLYLRDVSKRLPNAVLHGVDRGEDMLEHAQSLEYTGATPMMHDEDISEKLPFEDGSIDLVTCTAVVHTLEDPFQFLDEVRRVLAPNGVFLLYDWVRVPYGDYIDYRDTEPGDPPEARYPRALEMFATHNKYTADDWRWIFQVGRYAIVKEAWPYVRAIALLTTPA
jgi:ubiquinone/menaquinone biosynthesis C-methylase UbiE